MLGFSENHFRDRVLPDLGVIRGSRPRVLVADLESWAAEHRDRATAKSGACGLSASPTAAVSTNTRRAFGRSPNSAGLAKRLLEKANRSTPRRSKAGA